MMDSRKVGWEEEVGSVDEEVEGSGGSSMIWGVGIVQRVSLPDSASGWVSCVLCYSLGERYLEKLAIWQNEHLNLSLETSFE